MHVFFWGVVVLSGAILMDPTMAVAAENKAEPKWAIVIHGGAGGDPSHWDEAKTTNRKLGLERALQTGREMLAEGQRALDVVETVIRVLEDDAAFNAGRGAVLTEEGRAELDASIMDGSTLACGAVAGVTRVKNPITLARRVMSETKHVLLAGPGADRFAEQQQVTLVDPDYFLSSRLRNSSSPSAIDPAADVAAEETIASETKRGEPPSIGTVGCVVLDVHGNLAAGTSTGGTSKKLPGRVGDSPIVGAGTYAANGVCAVSGTGIGEEYIRNAVAFDVAAQMQYAGRTMADAIHRIMTQTLKPGAGGLIAVSHRGEIVMQHNTPGMSCGAATSEGRFETFLALPDGGAPKQAQNPSQVVIEAILHQQVHAWNQGDLDGFLEPYWNSEQLTFSSGGQTTRGFRATRQRYQERYPNRESMGNLEFSELEFLELGAEAMQVLGSWQLRRESAEPIGGRFTLVLRKLAEGWKIVHDHTSVLPDTEN